jgi:hypothetical protein
MESVVLSIAQQAGLESSASELLSLVGVQDINALDPHQFQSKIAELCDIFSVPYPNMNSLQQLTVECPICGESMPEREQSYHIDECLVKEQQSRKIRKIDPETEWKCLYCLEGNSIEFHRCKACNAIRGKKFV